MHGRIFLLSVLSAIGAAWSLGSDNADLEGWEPYAQRQALMPVMAKSSEKGTLETASSGHFRCNGSWRKSFPIDSGNYYAFSVEYSATNVTLPRRSILARIDWKDGNGKQLSLPDYPATTVNGELNRITGHFRAPDGATTATVELIFRWDKKGSVSWRKAKLTRVSATKPRKVVLGAIYHRPRESSGPAQNLESFARFLRVAGERGADIVCLPEGVTVIGTGKDYLEVAEPIPGPTTRALGELARRYSMYIVAGLYERRDNTYYNVSVLIDRSGLVAGIYRKVSLPRGEIDAGLTPGSEFPVFETDFGKVGMMICWDSQFPEAARRLASQGAEIILLPVWGGNETLFAARAIENQIHLVTSSYDAKTGIWNRKGELLAEASEPDTVAIAEVDLSEVISWEWIGDLRAHIPRESPPVKEE